MPVNNCCCGSSTPYGCQGDCTRLAYIYSRHLGTTSGGDYDINGSGEVIWNPTHNQYVTTVLGRNCINITQNASTGVWAIKADTYIFETTGSFTLPPLVATDWFCVNPGSGETVTMLDIKCAVPDASCNSMTTAATVNVSGIIGAIQVNDGTDYATLNTFTGVLTLEPGQCATNQIKWTSNAGTEGTASALVRIQMKDGNYCAAQVFCQNGALTLQFLLPFQSNPTSSSPSIEWECARVGTKGEVGTMYFFQFTPNPATSDVFPPVVVVS